MDTATDARVRLLLQIRQLLTDPRGNVDEDGWAPLPRLAATRLVMVVVCTICQETGREKRKKDAAKRGSCFGVPRQQKQKARVRTGAGEGCRRRRKCGSKSRRVGSAVRQYVRTVPYLPSSLTAFCAPPSLGPSTVGRCFHYNYT